MAVFELIEDFKKEKEYEKLFSSTKYYEPVITNLGRPTLIVLVDTEEEFDWNAPFSRENTHVDAIAALPRAQKLFDRWNVVPTYLVDYPVVTSSAATELLRDWVSGGRCLLGAQLHPWVTPPHVEDVNVENSFPGNLPQDLERDKLRQLSDKIRENLGVNPRIYKAGRYGIGKNTLKILEECGYLVDTSVVPYTSFNNEGGPHFGKLQNHPYWFGNKHRILELPVTRGFVGPLRSIGSRLFPPLDRMPIAKKIVSGGLAHMRAVQRVTLTPEGITLAEMKLLTNSLLESGHSIFTLSFHSPSLASGNTPYVRSREQEQQIIHTLDRYLSYFLKEIGGVSRTPFEVLQSLEACEGGNSPGDAVQKSLRSA